ncbi:hypothetical protein [Streptosporangium carneum]|uniref:Uncharacterized protein n=1 Tax=Streptosporangium carneum TaxID=47481 RepID=A0A9W6I362_9ACTN|nr:hypothetical protein [Streptosporangium carneum]GLK11191.1 hypothetical protein GCM10017600_45970 [Streptosporangium carneum]
MRFNLRRTLAVGAMLAVVGVVTPAVAAYSQDDDRSCNDLMGDDAPAFIVCRWLAKPDEAYDIVKFWAGNDAANLKGATPSDGKFIDCSAPGTFCPELEGDGAVGDENTPLPEGTEDGGTPECEAGQECSVGGYEEGGDGTESAAEPGSPADPAASSKTKTTTQSAAPAVQVAAPTAQEVAAAAQSPVGQVVTAARTTGLRVWIDTELADDWKAGAANFAAAVKRIAVLAARPEVAGIRFSSQLGYNTTFKTDDEVLAFVTAASTALRQAVPGKRLGVHTVVPELACGANDACKTEMRKRYPLLAPERIESHLIAGRVDQLSLDSGLLYGGYDTWKINAEEAQRNQWIQVRARAWDVLGQVAAEETGLVGQVTAEQVAARVSKPVLDGSAQQVNVWTRVQDAKGTVTRLTAWDELKKLTPIQRRVAAVYDPATPEVNTASDLKKLSEVFGQVYLTTV